MEAEKLDHNWNDRRLTATTATVNTTSTSSSSLNTSTLSLNNSTESQANQSLTKTNDENNKTDKNSNFVIKSQELISGSNIYSMQSKPRGFCIIINNVDFDDNRFPRRVGSDEECQRLSNIFSRLYFEVQIHRNVNREEVLKRLRSTAKHNDLKKHDCLVVIILSHGNSGQIIAADNSGLEFEKVLTIFNNQNCHQLIKKPKMFFFNCCRGSTLDFGPQFTVANIQEEDRDVADATLWPHVPIISDMMVCFSTINGYVSWRNEHNGTWFGSALAMALENNASTSDLNQILTFASDIVHNRTTKNGAKQAIEWKYMAWTKSLYFNPGYPNE